MKKKWIGIILLVVAAIFIFFLWPKNKRSVILYLFEGKSYRLMVADEPEEWTRGLMYYHQAPAGIDGMIFIFPDKEKQTFWNKNTYIDLQLYWLADGRVVGKSYLPAITKSQQIVYVNSPTEVNAVVEIFVENLHSSGQKRGEPTL